MKHSAEKKSRGSGASKVLLHNERRRQSHHWRLDVRQDTAENDFAARHNKLFHYIASGGLRQLQRTLDDDITEHKQRSFAIFLVAVALGWVILYFLPLL